MTTVPGATVPGGTAPRVPAPRVLVVVAGTGTEIGKTWVSAALARALLASGVSVAARKAAQSYAPGELGSTDAERLAEAVGGRPEEVCPRHRWYPAALAPPMAAAVLGRPPVLLADLLDELRWPPGADVGLVEQAGGLAAPQSEDADGVAVLTALRASLAVVVADAGLGTLHAVRTTVAYLLSAPYRDRTARRQPAPGAGRAGGAAGPSAVVPLGAPPAVLAPGVPPFVVHLNRFDPDLDIHRRNRAWLAERDGLTVTTTVAELAERVGRLARRHDDPSAR